MALAETSELHPYEIQGYAPLIDAMREIRDRPHLDATARNALDAVLDQHLRIEQARADIDHYLDDTARAFRSLENLKVSTAAGICTGAAAQKCTTGSVVACPRSPWEGPARGATRPPRGWRRPARGRMEWTPPTPDAGGREG